MEDEQAAHEFPPATGSRVMWLGAGFSRSVTDGAAPLMSDYLNGISPEQYSALTEFVGALASEPITKNVEQVIRELEDRERLPLSPKLARNAGCCWNYEAIYEDVCAFSISRLGCLDIAPASWSAELFLELGLGATIITTNYDNLVERLVSCAKPWIHAGPNVTCPHCKMCAILNEQCECAGGDSVATELWRGGILKLHGSVAWQMCSNSNCNAFNCLQPDPKCRAITDRKCRCCGFKCQPVLVMPSERKQYSRFPQIHRMWDSAWEALTQMEELFVWGFAFSKTDQEIQHLVREATSQNHQLKDVHIFDVDPDGVKDRLWPLLPDRDEISVWLWKIPQSNERPEWLLEPVKV